MASKTVYRDSPFLPSRYNHLNQPDTKYKSEFKSDLVGDVSDPQVQKLMELIDEAAQAAFDDMTSEMSPKERKGYELFKPYEIETDDDDEPTGKVIFKFRQNSEIKIKSTGEVKNIKIGIYDAAGKPSKAIVFGGSVIRINYSMRPIKVVSAKTIGVRLDFGRIQIKQLAEGSGGGGFGAVEGYEEEEGFEPDTSGPAQGGTAEGADY